MFDQDPNEQANISGADFAIMCDEMAKLRADLAAALEMKRMLLEHNNTLTAERDAATLRADAAQEELRMASDALEDLADTVSKALSKAWSFGQTYWVQADSESYSQNRKSIETQSKFHDLVNATRTAILSAPLRAAPVPAISATDTEVKK